MFANDTSLLNGCHSKKVAYLRMKTDMESVVDWFRANKLKNKFRKMQSSEIWIQIKRMQRNNAN